MIKEEHPLAPSTDCMGGYTQTKWVAEQIAMLARDLGLPLSIYRPGRITGHGESGVGNVDDFMCRMIKGCIELGCYPRLSWEEKCASVDYCAKAIVYVSNQSEVTSELRSLQLYRVCCIYRLMIARGKGLGKVLDVCREGLLSR